VAFLKGRTITLPPGETPQSGEVLSIHGRAFTLKEKSDFRDALLPAVAVLCIALGYGAHSALNTRVDPPAGSVVGVVYDNSGQPFTAGAVVRIPTLGKSVIADQFGFFRFDRLTPGMYRLEYSLSDNLVGQASATIREEGITTVALKGAVRATAPAESSADLAINTSRRSVPPPTTHDDGSEAQGVGSLNVSCDIIGAQVTLDGRAMGSVNQTFRNIPTGERRLRVTREGFAPSETIVTIHNGKMSRTQVTLAQSSDAEGARGAASTVATAAKTPYDIYINARDLASAGDKQGALRALDDAILADPGLAEAYYLRGDLREERNEHAEAAWDFIKAGEIWASKKQAQSARQAFDHAVAAVPNDPNPFRIRGDFLAAEGNFSDAIEDYTSTIRLDKRNYPAQRGMGVAYFRQGAYRQADIELRRAKDLNPKDPSLYHYLMLNSLAKNDLSELNRAYSEFKSLASDADMRRFSSDDRLVAVRRIVSMK